MKTTEHKMGISLRSRLLICFCILFVFVAAGSALGYTLALRSLYRLTINSMGTALDQVNSEAGRILLSVQDRTQEISRNRDLQISLRSPLPESAPELYRGRLDFNNQLYYESIQVESIDSLYVIGENGMMLHSRHAFRQYDHDYRQEEWYREVISSGEVLWLSPHPGSMIGNNLDAMTISIIVPIRDRISPRILGVVAADVLVDTVRPSQDSSIVLGGILCFLDQSGEVIYMDAGGNETAVPSAQDINAALSMKRTEQETGSYLIPINGENYLAESLALSESNWQLFCLVPARKVLAQVSTMRNLLILLTLLVGLLGIGFSFLASESIVRPVRTLQEGMKKVETGDFTVCVPVQRNDEIGNLTEGFNHMTWHVKDLMEKEREMQEKLKLADFNALQAQINPHFLYNTLDSINWMARFNKTDQVSEMIGNLTSFLRIGLSRGRVFIPLSDELRHVESYIEIQKVRYQRLLKYSIDVPDELLRYKVIKMILQPLVENAIDHGIREKDAPGLITITGRESRDFLLLYVEDTGQGMTPDRLNEVREMLREDISPAEEVQDTTRDAYGILNVQRRIRSYFGAEYGLQYESSPGEGTKVTILLPRQEAEAQNV